MADPQQNIVAVELFQSFNNRGGAVENSFESAETRTPLPDAAQHPGTTSVDLKPPMSARHSNHAPPPFVNLRPGTVSPHTKALPCFTGPIWAIRGRHVTVCEIFVHLKQITNNRVL